jgi:alpha-D-ribose 1-methylphosphonate 5-triphosphate synthase subunit PhnL
MSLCMGLATPEKGSAIAWALCPSTRSSQRRRRVSVVMSVLVDFPVVCRTECPAGQNGRF